MSDGAYQGYRSEMDARERNLRMAKFGSELCFTCGKAMSDDGPYVSVPFDGEMFKNFKLAFGNDRKPILHEKVRFCGAPCLEKHVQSLRLIEGVRRIMARKHEMSPALRTNVWEHVRAVMDGEGKPDV